MYLGGRGIHKHSERLKRTREESKGLRRTQKDSEGRSRVRPRREPSFHDGGDQATFGGAREDPPHAVRPVGGEPLRERERLLVRSSLEAEAHVDGIARVVRAPERARATIMHALFCEQARATTRTSVVSSRRNRRRQSMPEAGGWRHGGGCGGMEADAVA